MIQIVTKIIMTAPNIIMIMQRKNSPLNRMIRKMGI